MSPREQQEFQEYLKTLNERDQEWALDMASRGESLEDIKYYIEF